MSFTAIIIFLSILFTLVVAHEFGHFIFAKLFKMRVDEFAFGFPPRIASFRYGETKYSINLIPLGGYVKIFGENGLDEEEKSAMTEHDKKRLFGNKPVFQKIIVLCGGVIFNILAAIILFSGALMYGSNIYLEEKEIVNVDYHNRSVILVELNEKSPLLGTGITFNDKITKVKAADNFLENETLNSYALSKFIQENNNANIEFTFTDKSGIVKTAKAIPQAGIVEGKKIIGAKFADTTFKKYGFFESLPESLNITYNQTLDVFSGLYTLLQNLIFKDAKVEDNISGPIGLAVMTSKVSEQGLDHIFIFAAMLSLSLAVFNILPIPALDGGRILFIIIDIFSDKVLKRKLKATTEQLFHGLGFLALLCLMLFVSYFDIVKAFN